MFLSKLSVENYRTFRHVDFSFDEGANYIVGDNNIGKSNLLALFSQALSGAGFAERDFMDPAREIRVTFTLSDADTGERQTARLLLTQRVEEAAPSLSNADTGEKLPLEVVRRMYFLFHSPADTARQGPSHEQAEELVALFREYLQSGEEAAEELSALLSEYGFPVDLSGGAETAALRLFAALHEPAEAGGRTTLQVTLAAGAYILAALRRLKRSRTAPFEEIVMTDARGRRLLPVMLGIDEPERHLHPYMQRAVLAFLRRIFANRVPFFVKLLQKTLGIDGLDGQIFIVTHSTDALINDYRAILRLYRGEQGEVRAACGADFRFDQEIEKHLIMHFPEVKEALFSRCAVLVEGETEYGSFGYFAHTLGTDFDYAGICLINARGESSISKICQLLRRFHVPSVALYDRDVIATQRPTRNVFYTDGLCYEMDVVNACLGNGRRALLDAVVADVGEGMTNVSSALVKKACGKLGLARSDYPPKKLEQLPARDVKKQTFYYFAWLYGNKGVIIGRALGLRMKREDIPPAFARVIRAAAELSK